MNWLAQNWFFVVAIIIALFFVFGAKGQTDKRRQARSVVGSVQAGQYQDQRELMQKILDFMDDAINVATSNKYSSQQRIKIAAGMIALMYYQKLSPEKLFNPSVFAALMLRTIEILTKEGLL
jgi:hypothetical protein